MTLPDSFLNQDAEVTVGNEDDGSGGDWSTSSSPDAVLGNDGGSDDDDDVAGTVIDNDDAVTDYGTDDPYTSGGSVTGSSGVAEDIEEETGGTVDDAIDTWNEPEGGDTSDPAGGVEQALADQRAEFEAEIAALMERLPLPDQLGGSEGGGGLSPALGGVALLALAGGGALYVKGES